MTLALSLSGIILRAFLATPLGLGHVARESRASGSLEAIYDFFHLKKAKRGSLRTGCVRLLLEPFRPLGAVTDATG